MPPSGIRKFAGQLLVFAFLLLSFLQTVAHVRLYGLAIAFDGTSGSSSSAARDELALYSAVVVPPHPPVSLSQQQHWGRVVRIVDGKRFPEDPTTFEQKKMTRLRRSGAAAATFQSSSAATTKPGVRVACVLQRSADLHNFLDRVAACRAAQVWLRSEYGFAKIDVAYSIARRNTGKNNNDARERQQRVDSLERCLPNVRGEGGREMEFVPHDVNEDSNEDDDNVVAASAASSKNNNSIGRNVTETLSTQDDFDSLQRAMNRFYTDAVVRFRNHGGAEKDATTKTRTSAIPPPTMFIERMPFPYRLVDLYLDELRVFFQCSSTCTSDVPDPDETVVVRIYGFACTLLLFVAFLFPFSHRSFLFATKLSLASLSRSCASDSAVVVGSADREERNDGRAGSRTGRRRRLLPGTPETRRQGCRHGLHAPKVLSRSKTLFGRYRSEGVETAKGQIQKLHPNLLLYYRGEERNYRKRERTQRGPRRDVIATVVVVCAKQQRQQRHVGVVADAKSYHPRRPSAERMVR